MHITQRQAQLCSGLGDFHRLLILYAVADETHNYNVSALAQRLGLSQPTISRHLKILRDCGAVSAHRQGKAVFYAASDPRIIQALDMLRTVLMDQMKKEGTAAHEAADRPPL